MLTPALSQQLTRSPTQQVRSTTVTSTSASSVQLDSLPRSETHLPLGKDLAKHFTCSGCLTSLPSLGTCLTLPFKLSKIPYWIGTKIQGGHDKNSDISGGKVRFWAGAPLKGIGNLISGVGDVTQASIDFTAMLLKNLGSTALHLLSIYVVGAVKDFCFPAEAKGAVSRLTSEVMSPGWAAKAKQTTITHQQAQKALPLAKLMCLSTFQAGDEIEYVGFRDGTSGLPAGYSVATKEDIPSSILARRKGEQFTGADLNLHIDSRTGATLLHGDAWSSLGIGIFKEDNKDGKPGKIILCFIGTNPKRPGTIKSDINLTLGIHDSVLDDADKVVKAFIKKNGADNVTIVGHSLGGAIAQHVILNNTTKDQAIKGTVFNALGIHVTHRSAFAPQLPNSRINIINTAGDILSQGVGYLTASAQVGRRLVIPGNDGHTSDQVVNALIQTIIQQPAV